jgi:RHS repeat-associated protein
LSLFSYDRRADGQVLKATESVLQPDGSTATIVATFTYDALNRLSQEMVDSSVVGQDYTKIYTLDLVGNRTKLVTSKEGLPTETTISTYNSRDQLLTETTGSTTINYGYDDNGSLITQNGNGSSRTQAWDVRGRLQSAVVDGVLTSYGYTSDGIRSRVSVDGVTADYIVDSMTPSGYAQVVEELASGVLAVRYTYGASLDPISETRSGVTSVYLADGHSGVRQAVNLSGAVILAQRFDAYGVSVVKAGTLATPIGYRGERFDATLGQYYLRARYYDPRSGRFTSVDPYQGNYGDTSQAMRYGYAGANPIWASDPSGMWSAVSVSISVGALVGFGYGAYRGYQSTGKFFHRNTFLGALLGTAAGGAIGFGIGIGATRLLARVAPSITKRMDTFAELTTAVVKHPTIITAFVLGAVAGAATGVLFKDDPLLLLTATAMIVAPAVGFDLGTNLYGVQDILCH